MYFVLLTDSFKKKKIKLWLSCSQHYTQKTFEFNTADILRASLVAFALCSSSRCAILFPAVAKNPRNKLKHFERKRDVERNAASFVLLKPLKTENGYKLITFFMQNHEAGTKLLHANRGTDINLIQAICNLLSANALQPLQDWD